MRKYNLKCLLCSEDGAVYAKADEPDNFFCKSCEEEFTLADVREFVADWNQYLADYDAMSTEGDK